LWYLKKIVREDAVMDLADLVRDRKGNSQ
jgi:hypothetical protein